MKGISIEEASAEFSTSNSSQFKNALTEVICEKICPIGEEFKKLEKDKEFVDQVLREGAQNAQEIASKVMFEVKSKVGLVI